VADIVRVTIVSELKEAKYLSVFVERFRRTIDQQVGIDKKQTAQKYAWRQLSALELLSVENDVIKCV